jgi:arsenate reductase-like glutaredoxin family protein
VTETVDARKTKLGRGEALRLARAADRVLVAKGKNILELDIKRDEPTDDELAAALLGPTGNLKAPAIRRGKSLLVGFDEKLFADNLK